MSDIIVDNQNKKKALGRGLGSLLGGMTQPESSTEKQNNMQTNQPQAIVTEGKVWQVAIDKLHAGAFQPRLHFKKESLDELAQSIRSNGILQPITVRKSSQQTKFEIIAGERRWRAAQIAGLHEVPVLIKNYTDKESLELAIIENVQREDLDPIEEAEAYFRLAQEFQLSQQQISEKVGKERATVANALRLLSLPVEVKAMVSKKEISVGHAKALLTFSDADHIIKFAKRVHQEKMSVRQLEKLVQNLKSNTTSESRAKAVEQNVTQGLIKGLSEELHKCLGTKVNIDYANSKGKISIYFYSDDELTQIIDRLKE